jgi:hypothetical protein
MVRDSGNLERITSLVDRAVNQFSQHARELDGFGLFDQGYSGDAIPLSERLDATEIKGPEKDEPLHWTGIHAANYNEESGNLELGVRERNPSERGHTFAIYETAPQDLIGLGLEGGAKVAELEASELADGQAVSVEGGTMHQTNGGHEVFLSYHDEVGDWRIEKFDVDELENISPGEGESLRLDSDYPNQKDPVIIDDEMYFISTTSSWLDSAVEKAGLEDLNNAYDEARREIETEEVSVRGGDNVRVTGGGEIGNELLVDEKPDFPYTDFTNLLWNQDERSRTAEINGEGDIEVDDGEHFVSASGGSARYLRSVQAEDDIYLFWEEEQPSGSHSAYAARLAEGEYRELFS